MSIRVGIGLGSNSGDRLRNLQRARAAILALPLPAGTGTDAGAVAHVSAPVYETDPVGCPAGTEAFLNTVMEIPFGVRCSPLMLLSALRQIESSLGRPSRYPRNAPRAIDLDLLYAGELRIRTAELDLPHPRLHLRRFVLTPLAAIRPTLRLPGITGTVEELLQALDDPARVERLLDSW